ncbi:hypothetical protein RAH32_19160 [Paracoccus sp. WLY502]|nr:hypothetical protein [Paracoccus sp. WLY502]MDQ1902546.1 hypothetical protein [Paracoccus sp. WLY502]
MEKVTVIGIDLAKSVFQLHGATASWLCRDTDPNSLSQEELRQLCAGLNATPRKCLGFRTPAEVFKANLLGRRYRREKLSRQPKSHFSYRVQGRLTCVASRRGN